MPRQHPHPQPHLRPPWRSRLAGWLRGVAESIDPDPDGVDLSGAPDFWAEHVRTAARRARKEGRVFRMRHWGVGERADPGPARAEAGAEKQSRTPERPGPRPARATDRPAPATVNRPERARPERDHAPEGPDPVRRQPEGPDPVRRRPETPPAPVASVSQRRDSAGHSFPQIPAASPSQPPFVRPRPARTPARRPAPPAGARPEPAPASGGDRGRPPVVRPRDSATPRPPFEPHQATTPAHPTPTHAARTPSGSAEAVPGWPQPTPSADVPPSDASDWFRTAEVVRTPPPGGWPDLQHPLPMPSAQEAPQDAGARLAHWSEAGAVPRVAETRQTGTRQLEPAVLPESLWPELPARRPPAPVTADPWPVLIRRERLAAEQAAS